MSNPCLNPAIRIYPRHGRILAWEPGLPRPHLLTLADIGRLGRMLEAAAFDERQRVELERARFMLTEAVELPTGQPLPEADPLSTLPERLRLAGGVALQFGRHGWIAWSTVTKDYCRLDADSALLLMAAGDGQPRAALLGLGGTPPETRALRLRQLHKAGLLLETSATPTAPTATTPAIAPAVHLRDGDPFAGLAPDGRRPIYFVTHHVDHLPLALGMLRAHILEHDGGALLRHYQPLPIVSLDVAGMQALFRRFGPGVWLFSNYMWSYEHNRRLSTAVKAADPRNITIHGGPSAPKYEAACARFMQANPHVDIVVRGEGETTLVELLGALASGDREALASVAGITYFRDVPQRQTLVRTAERVRQTALDALPSPYLSGQFDHYGGQVVAAILETNRGCPFACTFCDWGSATASKIRSFELERVKAEIDWIGRKQIRVLWIADANFGIFRRDVEIAEHIAATKARHGYPREVVVNYPKNATEKIADIVRIFARAGICSQGIISIQTTDPATLAVIRRDNIKTRKYDELGEIFRRENLPLSTDLMIGLPGATVASFKRDLQYYFDDDVGVKAYRTQLLPNAPMSDPDYLQAHAIRTDAQQFLISTASYSEADLAEMMAIWELFDIADGHALLRYVLRFLQWEHGIAATEFLHALLIEVRAQPSRYPSTAWLLRHFLQERQVLGGWPAFYAEIARFAGERFAVAHDVGFAIALEVNRLMMPEPGRRFPERHALAHDFVRYFEQHARARGSAGRRLAEYPPGTLEITDPYRMCELDYRAIEQYDNHQVFFELASPISRRRSVPNFVEKNAA